MLRYPSATARIALKGCLSLLGTSFALIAAMSIDFARLSLRLLALLCVPSLAWSLRANNEVAVSRSHHKPE